MITQPFHIQKMRYISLFEYGERRTACQGKGAEGIAQKAPDSQNLLCFLFAGVIK